MSQRLLEDGTSKRLLEDGASIRLLEDGATATIKYTNLERKIRGVERGVTVGAR